MTDKVSIISAALVLLGQSPVTDLDESNTTRAASRMYDTLFKAYLEMENWWFARQISQLNELADEPDNPNYKTAYELPPYFRSVITTHPFLNDYQLSQRQLLANITGKLQLEYTIEVQERWLPASFVLLLEYGMAARLAKIVTNANTLVALYKNEEKDQLSLCRQINYRNAPQPAIQRNETWAAHFT